MEPELIQNLKNSFTVRSRNKYKFFIHLIKENEPEDAIFDPLISYFIV